MATATPDQGPRLVKASPTVDDLVSELASGPVVVESAGRPVAVLVDVERYREMQAVYEWHLQLREERRAS